MTATITSIAQGFDVGNRGYCFHGRTSTVAAGSLWTAAAAWWFVSLAGVVTKRHHGLELVHNSQVTGERVDFLLVDEDGTAEWATHATTTVATSYDFTCYKASAGNGGSDANTGLTAGSPKLTFDGINAVLRANWVTDGEHLVVMVGDDSVTTPTGGYIWNHCTTAGGSTPLDGRVTWYSAAGSTITITDLGSGAVSLTGLRHGFVSDGISVTGPYTVGGSASTASLINHTVSTTGGLGHNVTMLRGTWQGALNIHVFPTTGVDESEMANGSFDWFIVENCTLDHGGAYLIQGGPFRYHGLYNVAFERTNGTSSGSKWRCNRTVYMSQTGCTFDATGDSWQANAWRINGGPNTSAYDIAQYCSIHDCHLTGTTEGFESDVPNSSDTLYLSDIWFHACSLDHATTGTSISVFGINNGGGTSSQDITRVRITNCWGRGTNGNHQFCRVDTNGSSTTEKIHSLWIDQCSFYQLQASGFFSRSTIFLNCSGNTANYDAGSITLLSNYAFCAEASGGGSDPMSFMALVSGTHIATSNYNVCACVASSGLTWETNSSLATWQGATVHDDNSFEIVSASHNMTNVTAGSFDPEPAADGTPSAALPQVRRGMPGLGYADADRYLRDATLPDAGSHEYGTGTLMDDPDFGGGGGGGSYPNGQTDGFCTYS